jgi:hypothetical protein
MSSTSKAQRECREDADGERMDNRSRGDHDEMQAKRSYPVAGATGRNGNGVTRVQYELLYGVSLHYCREYQYSTITTPTTTSQFGEPATQALSVGLSNGPSPNLHQGLFACVSAGASLPRPWKVVIRSKLQHFDQCALAKSTCSPVAHRLSFSGSCLSP